MAKLQREKVIRAALDLLNEVGVDGLTTRRLADHLGVQQPALYWHFKNKRALLDALAHAMLAERHTHAVPRPEDDWCSFITGNARSFRQALLSYRDGARIHAGTRPNGAETANAEAQLRCLTEAGFTPADTTYALMTISYFVVGSVMEQQAAHADRTERADLPLPAATSPLLAEAMETFDREGPDTAFERGLGFIIAGLKEKLQR
ncbi:tetracycline resistance transcriptional repressor TetR [Labrys sp. (in: a-proteobacteria)]|uniref:tetracycline resistance transcriptional repressor TetR n=1 Tax=Labrys sp. (in: a-proteobacteria) TaxID=1917972 RepID=UPI0039E47100